MSECAKHETVLILNACLTCSDMKVGSIHATMCILKADMKRLN